MTHKSNTDIDVQRAWELFQMKGATVKDVAFTMNTTVADVRAALTQHAQWERTIAIKEIKAQRVIAAERCMFNNAFPYLKNTEGPAWDAWVARSKLKTK